MARTPTPTQQRNSFSEGFALGLILNGRRSLPYNKIDIDLAVTAAFRNWPHAGAFPQIKTDLRGLDGVHAMTRVDERKQTSAFYWDQSGPELTIVSRDCTWSVEDSDDVSHAVRVVSDLVPQAGWQILAEEFLIRFER
ncbi:hypothetical protein QUG92_15805 [Curtobacterium sp. RHCKG23]|uniref:Uncharacterized protein n=1 Tax=Curtobacterium citri TaxID=3055139 RepID=A0ABT7TAI7_9MICO|nr:hypothetical protein [Curtobacterium citri]MDM7886576.1 hypothetical protein [Curtobacterium citri]